MMVLAISVGAQTSILDSLTNKIKPNVNINIQTDSLTSSLKGLVPDSTLPFYREVYGDLKAASHVMAEGLGVAIKELFDIVVTQQLVKSVTNLVFVLFAILFGYWAFKVGKSTEWYKATGRNVGAVFLGVTCLFFVIWTFVCVNETVTGFMNPKYGAIKDIVEMASDIKNGNHSRCTTCK